MLVKVAICHLENKNMLGGVCLTICVPLTPGVKRTLEELAVLIKGELKNGVASSSLYTEYPTVHKSYTEISSDDATWILTSAFIIFTMQSGFGLLESGMVSSKNEANIMVKNAVDVIYGGLAYWVFGFALSFGTKERNNGFCGLGYFFTDAEEHEMGTVYAKYFFQLSFSTTATTIVSGAMAERASLKAYTLFSFVNTITYCFPAHWIWDEMGWLKALGAVDIAGGSAVHLVGGISGLVATLILKPRHGKFDPKCPAKQMASPTNVLLGTFMLWWGWLGFNCGSTFGISGAKWKLASSYLMHKKQLNIHVFVTGILGGLVSITAICSVARPWEALVIGSIGALIACSGCSLLEKLKIDDPVGCVPTHAFAGIWGLIAVGLFAEKDTLEGRFSNSYGVFKGGPWRFLGVQLLLIVAVVSWGAVTTFLELKLIDKIFPLRVTLENELLGADDYEHGIKYDFLEFEEFQGPEEVSSSPPKTGGIVDESNGIIVSEQVTKRSSVDVEGAFRRKRMHLGKYDIRKQEILNGKLNFEDFPDSEIKDEPALLSFENKGLKLPGVTNDEESVVCSPAIEEGLSDKPHEVTLE
ncbi:putative ammonium transporter 3 isoform X2 [Nematostella vectensis]|uniref:putative ammonium transporter 3 isoform X2 n=1 Tax=Nematostella vectensis TaxID=45351 RepID=UPI00207754E9|nr:putative ammonium transporter 3 isoform X2 [Nematostella vectensis]